VVHHFEVEEDEASFGVEDVCDDAAKVSRWYPSGGWLDDQVDEAALDVADQDQEENDYCALQLVLNLERLLQVRDEGVQSADAEQFHEAKHLDDLSHQNLLTAAALRKGSD